PYLPFLEAIGNWLSSSDIAAVRRRLGPSARELGQLFPQLSQDAPVEGMDPAQAKLRLFESVLVLIRLAAEERGLLLILEDLHWADASTRELLDYMTRRLRGVPALLLATYRSDEMHRRHPLLPIIAGWRRSGSVRIVELQPLAPDDVAGMIGAIFSKADITSEFSDFFHQRTDGNPFVLEETLKEAIDRGDIYPTDAGWERKSLTEIGIPRSVAHGILARVERLHPRHAEVVRSAAVLGSAFWYSTLVALCGIEEEAVQEALHACIREQLLIEDAVPGRYRFRHALTREAVYDDTILPRRQALHARIADLLAADPQARAADVAHHLLAAGKFEEAIPVCLEAADDAVAHSALAEAVALYERVLSHIADRRERAVVMCKLGEASLRITDSEKTRRYLEEGIGVLDELGEHAAAARWHLALGRAHWLSSGPDDAHREYETARAALEPAGPSEMLARAYIGLAGLRSFNYEYRESLRLAERAIEIAEAAGADLPRVWACGFKGCALLIDPDADEQEAFRWLDRAVDESIAKGFVDVATNMLHNSISTRLVVGRAREASALMARIEELPSMFPSHFVKSFLTGVQQLCLGNVSSAEQNLVAAVGLATGVNLPVLSLWSRRYLCHVLTYQLRLEEARSLLPEVEAGSERQELIERLLTCMQFALADGDTERAAEHARVMVRERDWTLQFDAVIACSVQSLAAAGCVEEATPLVEA
ncbi:MAG: ATP-binding protein, partial [Actinomycetota bacterium]